MLKKKLFVESELVMPASYGSLRSFPEFDQLRTLHVCFFFFSFAVSACSTVVVSLKKARDCFQFSGAVVTGNYRHRA